MSPDFGSSRWWATSVHYLAMAHFAFDRGSSEAYVWYMLFGWAECLEELKEEDWE